MPTPPPASEPVLSRQQAKSLKARNAIVRAATHSLIDHGYAATTIARVASLAGLSKGAVQYHFPSREDLIAAVAQTLLARVVTPLPGWAAANRSSPTMPSAAPSVGQAEVATAMRAVWTQWINTPSYRALLEILIGSRTDPTLEARLLPDLRAWQELFDAHLNKRYVDVDAEDAALLMLMTRSMMRGLLLQDRYDADPARTRAAIERWIGIVAPLLGNPPPR